MRKIRLFIMSMVILSLLIPTGAFAAVLPDDGSLEPNNALWQREDVVTVTNGIEYSDDGMKRAVYEETKTEVYHVHKNTGQRKLYHTIYEIVWTGQFRARGSSSGVWITDSDYVDVYYRDLERSVLIELMHDTMEFLG